MWVFWFFLWILVTLVVSGSFLWSIRILLQQKRGWKAYADKFKLTYRTSDFLKSPTIEGMIGGYKLDVFSEERATDDIRGKRFVTVVQISLPSGMPCAGVVAAKAFATFISQLGLSHTVKIEREGWDYTRIAQSDSPGVLETFLTPERLTALDTLARLPLVDLLWIFSREETFLRIETPEALENPARLDVAVKKLLVAARILSVST